MIFKDYYKILGLETNKVNAEEIKSAIGEQAKKYHPDVNVGNKKAEERFKDINEAYRVLSDSASKKKYDRMWIARIGGKKRTNRIPEKKTSHEEDTIFSEFFHMFFGNMKETQEEKIVKQNKKNPIKGENIETEINISIEEGFYGMEKRISLKTPER